MTFFDPKLRWALAQVADNRAYTVSQSAVEVLIDLGFIERYAGYLVRATEEGKRMLERFDRFGQMVK
jgi:predicted transcriptional regulator